MAARSGKRVLFVATAEALDDEMRLRIEAHKQSRPPGWRTLEVPAGVGPAITADIGESELVLVDCITLLVNNLMCRHLSADGERLDLPAADTDVAEEVAGLVNCIKQSKADFILVTNEVGLGVVPDNELARAYRDLLGTANQRLAAVADEVYFMVAGLAMKAK
jgi:adenosylcobinamide kinase/adenosylcobinamide-phosphate guanylyltransferase